MRAVKRISVVTVARNAARTIGATIQSVLAQEHEDIELIVIDGASTDGTAERVRSHGDRRIRLVSEPDQGMYDAINKALGLFTGDAVGMLNADDRFHDRRAVGRIADALREADMVHGGVDFRSPAHGRIVRRWRAQPRPRNGFRSGWMPAHPSFYVRRHVVSRVGRYDASIGTAADYEWMLRAVECGRFRLATVNHVLVDMSAGGRSTESAGAYLAHNWQALRARRRWLGAGPVDRALWAKPARKLGQFACLDVLR